MWVRVLNSPASLLIAGTLLGVPLGMSIVPFLVSICDTFSTAMTSAVAGGVAGGALTLMAGFIAWKSATGQIEAQKLSSRLMWLQARKDAFTTSIENIEIGSLILENIINELDDRSKDFNGFYKYYKHVMGTTTINYTGFDANINIIVNNIFSTLNSAHRSVISDRFSSIQLCKQKQLEASESDEYLSNSASIIVSALKDDLKSMMSARKSDEERAYLVDQSIEEILIKIGQLS